MGVKKRGSKPGDLLTAMNNKKKEGMDMKKGKKKEVKKNSKKVKKMSKKFAGKSMKLGGGGRFAKLKSKLASKGVKNPGAVASVVGRKKFGAKKMASMAKAGKKRAMKK